ncbi:MAG: hypothetical protein EBX41_08060, partial [Chitinophagia bacterium]|nr:hypothetical protein [Chitinophagia bacterium]
MSDNILKSRRNNGSNNQAIYWIVIGLLLAGCIYLYVSKNNTLKESEADHKSMSGKIDSVAAEREQVQKEFEAASARIDDLLTQNAKLDSSLRQDNTEIE